MNRILSHIRDRAASLSDAPRRSRRSLPRRVAARRRNLKAETIDLTKASDAFLARFAQELFVTHDRIFAGLDEQAFVRYIFHSGAEHTRIRVFRRPQGDLAGYAVAHRFSRVIGGKTVTIFRAEAGLLPESRAHGRTFYFYAGFVFKYRLLHPLRPAYYLGMLVHPSSYLLFAHCFRGVHPRRGCAIPDSVYRRMLETADAFGVPPVDPSDPLIRDVGWITRQAKPYWQRTRDPDVMFFRERNPGYRSGYGLLLYAPMSLPNLLGALPRHLYYRLRRRLSARRPVAGSGAADRRSRPRAD